MVTSKSEQSRQPNRLINESSTYLLQHAYNPVQWYAWGPEALARAKAEDKPILLSVGYAACHWCHVMEHESFEDEATAAIMNEHFVNIKVDREERTDIDEIYMKAVQMLTGHGGWPMTVFLTPHLKPFFGGTYFPPEDRHGLPGFKKLLLALAGAWKEQRAEIEESSDEITGHLRQYERVATASGAGDISYEVIDQSLDKLLRAFDTEWGGFGKAPKFPHSFNLDLAMRCSALNYGGKRRRDEYQEMVTTSLDRMAYGGMHDHIGGGFARYSVDRKWLIPHFEKMLYDNALLCRTYLNGYLLTGRDYWLSVARGILDFVLRELTQEDGGFYSSLDADSEGEEGKFYVWDREQIIQILGKEDGEFFADALGVTKQGNFEHGKSALNFDRSPEEIALRLGLTVEGFFARLDPLKEKMLQAREARVRPGRDEKVLTSWTSLMISALVEGYRVLQEQKYLEAAKRAAEFILGNLMKDGKLLRVWGQGKSKINAYADDYAFFCQALLDLSAVDPDPRWTSTAFSLGAKIIELFWDEDQGGLFYTDPEHEDLITRPKNYYDGAIPSAVSVSCFVFMLLGRLSNDQSFEDRAKDLLRTYAPIAMRVPDQFGNLLCAMEFYLSRGSEIVLIETEQSAGKEMLFAVYEQFLPNKSVLVWKQDCAAETVAPLQPLLEGRTAIGGKSTIYVCRNYTCSEPVTDVNKARQQISKLMVQQ